MVDEDIVRKPWGHEKIIHQNDRYVVKQIFVKKGHRLSRQFHELKTETMICIAGGGFLELYDIKGQPAYFRFMEHMMPYFIAPYCAHRLSAVNEDAVIVEVSTNHLDDVVRLDDDYGRADG